jgi:citronellol/citronellal dehydrogenase
VSDTPPFAAPDLAGKVAIVTGASRGIGKEIALALARAGADLVIAAKSEQGRDLLPGSIHETAEAIRALGRRALPVKTDVRSAEEVEAMVARAAAEFGRIDILVNNAGALHWKTIPDTPPRRFDLVNEVNVRGAYCSVHYALPHLLKAGNGCVIQMSPPLDLRLLGGKVAYGISKLGMSLLAVGLAQEWGHTGLRSCALWPVTAIESFATINHGLGGPAQWRKAAILADAVLAIQTLPIASVQGKCLLDEEVLSAAGVTDFERYLCVPGGKPLRIVGRDSAAGIWQS